MTPIIARSSQRVALVAACVACLLAQAIAQTEKVTISIVPVPNQSIHYVVTQEFSIQGSSEGGAKENQPPKPMSTLSGTIMAAYTLVTPAQTESGRITSQLTYDDSAAEIAAGDAPPQKETDRSMVGSTFTIVFDADGNVIDLTRAGADPSTIDTVKRTISETYKYFPTLSMSVGETVTLPLARAVPATLAPIGGPVTIDGRMTMTLVSVTADGPDRVAHCEQSFESTVVEHPEKTAYRENKLIIRGSRTAQINLNRRMVKASRMETTFENVRTPSTAEMPTLKQHGVTKATVTGRY